ncbi:hypothetical protein B0H63DRAFT_515149 [Podospora didyma]|uniref:2EXR domain-containing protein n=1 Tax=Podospora didyma TaxID=330526 RepID=A0AAE0N378_9PEZI|nr:hypothetical protein B0H63DRAFT_515149 [Podospora didyma]
MDITTNVTHPAQLHQNAGPLEKFITGFWKAPAAKKVIERQRVAFAPKVDGASGQGRGPRPLELFQPMQIRQFEASQKNKDKPVQKFPWFRQLPMEIQIRIWEAHMGPYPRIYFLEMHLKKAKYWHSIAMMTEEGWKDEVRGRSKLSLPDPSQVWKPSRFSAYYEDHAMATLCRSSRLALQHRKAVLDNKEGADTIKVQVDRNPGPNYDDKLDKPTATLEMRTRSDVLGILEPVTGTRRLTIQRENPNVDVAVAHTDEDRDAFVVDCASHYANRLDLYTHLPAVGKMRTLAYLHLPVAITQGRAECRTPIRLNSCAFENMSDMFAIDMSLVPKPDFLQNLAANNINRTVAQFRGTGCTFIEVRPDDVVTVPAESALDPRVRERAIRDRLVTFGCCETHELRMLRHDPNWPPTRKAMFTDYRVLACVPDDLVSDAVLTRGHVEQYGQLIDWEDQADLDWMKENKKISHRMWGEKWQEAAQAPPGGGGGGPLPSNFVHRYWTTQNTWQDARMGVTNAASYLCLVPFGCISLCCDWDP